MEQALFAIRLPPSDFQTSIIFAGRLAKQASKSFYFISRWSTWTALISN